MISKWDQFNEVLGFENTGNFQNYLKKNQIFRGSENNFLSFTNHMLAETALSTCRVDSY